MADGNVHLTVSAVGALASGPPIWWLSGSGTIACSFAAGMFTGIVLSPDLDYRDNVVPYKIMSILPPFGGKPWQNSWEPYRDNLSHRSPFTHWPILGTVVRLLYIALMALVEFTAVFAVWYIGSMRLAGEVLVPIITLSPRLSQWLLLVGLGGIAGLTVSDALPRQLIHCPPSTL